MAYLWRQLSVAERSALLEWRRRRSYPWHSPPHAHGANGTFLLTAACLQHAPILGRTPERMSAFCDQIHNALGPVASAIHAWCVLPNHYHLLVTVPDLTAAIRALGRLHGGSSYRWNREDAVSGRQVWHAASDRAIRGDRHFWATLNYVHQNPVRHGYVREWIEWPYGSAREFLDAAGPAEADRIRAAYPLCDYGRDWDEPWM